MSPAGIADLFPNRDRWEQLVALVEWREPALDEEIRWHVHDFGGVRRRCVQPLTFTPYAASRACSARCRFCSENLEREKGGSRAARLRPTEHYLHWLERALGALRGLPLSYSLSGLETTDDPDWMLGTLEVLDRASEQGVPVENRVLYSNGAGFAGPRGAELVDALRRFRLSWIELSRHHHDPAANQALMRFRPEIAIADADPFERSLQSLCATVPIKLVCIVQRGGVVSATDVCRYLAWAAERGVSSVIFREFSQLTAEYRRNATARYIDSARISVESLLSDCLAQSALKTALTPIERTHGYYFRNVRLRHASGMEVIFEWSDYAEMLQKHASERVYKLVFFPNGNLCAGWHPERDVLLNCANGHE